VNIRTATLRTPRRRIYSPSSVRRLPVKSRASAGLRLSRLEIAGIFAALVLFCTGVWTSYEVNRISDDIARLNSDHMVLAETGSQLERQREKLLRKEYLAPVGARLGLHPPKSDQIFTLK